MKETKSERKILSKGRIETKRQWGSKVKGSSVLQNISKGMVCLQQSESESKSHSVVSNSLQSHGILQARTLEWVAFPFSRGSSQPRIEPRFPALQVDSLPVEPQGKPRKGVLISSILNKGTLVYSQAERQGPPSKALEYDYNNKSKPKTQFSTRSQN